MSSRYPHLKPAQPIAALCPRDASGQQFVLYGDCCSGLAGAAHEATFAAINAVVARLWPPPEFMCFLGDEVSGLTGDYEALRAQWRHWLEHEMAWLDRSVLPVYHATSNHTTYDLESEQIYREMLSHLPRNGPVDQHGLSYYVRRDQLLLVFIHTSWSGLGGDGWVETAWLEQVLQLHADAPYKFVLGHQPVHSVNGYVGARMRDLAADSGRALWNVLVKHRVFAYLCSHMLAFDVQVHEGVLQIMSAGAGTAHVLPGEYLHCSQCAIDATGLRCQTLDSAGTVRERFAWPLELPQDIQWQTLPSGVSAVSAPELRARVTLLKFSGTQAQAVESSAETLLSAWDSAARLSPLWIGLCGPQRELTLVIARTEGRSPNIWRGPTFADQRVFAVELALHPGLGPGGMLWRWHEHAPWNSLASSSSWGADCIPECSQWSVGHDRAEAIRKPFRGSELCVRVSV
jgi:hypothetical protein